MQLRNATQAAHRRLDAAASALPLGTDAEFAAFLSSQYVARRAIEAGFEVTAPGTVGPPPVQSTLIAADLAVLDAAPPVPEGFLRFKTSDEALGAAWVVAGSSLGNKAILNRRRKIGLVTADSFLSDDALPSYFRRLLAVIERPASAERLNEAINGAIAAFAEFEGAIAAHVLEQAA